MPIKRSLKSGKQFLVVKISVSAFLGLSETFEGTYLTAVVTYSQLMFEFVLLLKPCCKTANVSFFYTLIELESSCKQGTVAFSRLKILSLERLSNLPLFNNYSPSANNCFSINIPKTKRKSIVKQEKIYFIKSAPTTGSSSK